MQKELEKLSAWFQSLPKPLGLMACNDDHGQHVLEACKLAEILVPEEMAVIGVDNDTLVCELSDPPLTSIALNTEAAGYRAAELLDQMMKGVNVETKKILVQPTHIVTRRSTDFIAVEDTDVAMSLRFIWQNCRSPIYIKDVTDNIAVSRRILEKKFKNILHRSILHEIQRARVHHISTMLLETDLSISEIAKKMGFPDAEHISRYFRKIMGVNLRDYRKTNSFYFAQPDFAVTNSEPCTERNENGTRHTIPKML